MGYYIDHIGGDPLPAKNKALILVRSGRAEECACPNSFSDIPSDKALLCCVDNGAFEALAYAYSESEFEYFKEPDGRGRQWLLMDKSLAERLSGFYATKSAHETMPTEAAPSKSVVRESVYRKPKKKKHHCQFEYGKGYAIINGVRKTSIQKRQQALKNN